MLARRLPINTKTKLRLIYLSNHYFSYSSFLILFKSIKLMERSKICTSFYRFV